MNALVSVEAMLMENVHKGLVFAVLLGGDHRELINRDYLLYFRVSGCGGDVSQNSTHIQNTGYPSPFKTATTCSYTFKKINLEICFFRLEFVNFILTGTQSSSSHECSVDYVRVLRKELFCLIFSSGRNYNTIIKRSS